MRTTALSIGLVVLVYVLIYVHVKRSTMDVKKIGGVAGKRHSRLSSRFVLLVASNCLCWAPTCTLSLLCLLGYKMAPDVLSAMLGIALPINSVLNPCFYTFGASSL